MVAKKSTVNFDPNTIAFSVSNACRTGNVAVDMSISQFICLVVPSILTWVFGFFQSKIREIQGWWLRFNDHPVKRVVKSKTYTSRWGSTTKDDNQILHKAILTYIHEKYPNWLDGVGNALTSLINPDTVGDAEDSDSYSDDDDDNDNRTSSGDDGEILTPQERQLRAFKVLQLPPQGLPIEIEPGLFLSVNTKHKGKKSTRKVVTFTLSCEEEDGDRIDEFIQSAYEFYTNHIAKKHHNKRYMLTLAEKRGLMTFEEHMEDDEEEEEQEEDDEGAKKRKQSSMRFVKYELSDDKTFDSLFIPQQRELISLIDDFVNHQGKFAISGFPNKLGILLHGPPGTGKTSLIKAIAQYTGRHIVSVPLKRLDTNQELIELMFSQEFNVGLDLPMQLPWNRVIFTLEDMDSASDIVLNRGDRSAEDSMARRQTIMKMIQMKNKQDKVDEEKKKKKEKEGKERLEEKSGEKDPLGKDKTKDKDTDMMNDLILLDMLESHDLLDLAGLLNVLDGVLDSPGRIVIMTTNHPERLDPALIRPGRINLNLHLGHMLPNEAIQMISHFMGPVSDDQMRQLTDCFPKGVITPAQLEVLCTTAQSIDDIIDTIAHSSHQL